MILGLEHVCFPFQLYAVDEADVNEAMAGPGMNAKKRQGDTAYSSNKKRRKNETPPPSRRPQGSPNVPPPRPATPPVKVPVARQSGPMREMAILNEVVEDKLDIEEMKEKEVEKGEKPEKVLENGLSPDKRAVGKAVNKQLRKMQAMHKNKLSKGLRNSKPETVASLSNDGSSSPILSILRTSFSSEDVGKTNDRLDDIEVDVDGKTKPKPFTKEEFPAKRPRIDAALSDKPALNLRQCRILLQSYRNTKLRIEAWKEIRNFRGISLDYYLLPKLPACNMCRVIFLGIFFAAKSTVNSV